MRVGDGVLTVPSIKETDRAKIKMNYHFESDPMRFPIAVSLGCEIMGAALPHVDPEPLTTLAGVLKRFHFKMPKPNKFKLRKLKRFARRWLQKNIRPLDGLEDLDFDEWIISRTYSQARKEELIKLNEDLIHNSFSYKDHILKCFVKDEFYTDIKHARGIYSRDDSYKVKIGPMIAAIEKRLFKTKHFIKKIPLPDRPQYLEDMFGKFDKVMVTDFSSFEQSFTEEIMRSLDFILFEHMMSNFSKSPNMYYRVLWQMLSQDNILKFKWFTIFRRALRCSGEMNTSLSNGFANLMVAKFLLYEKNIDDESSEIVVEGDDGIVANTYNVFPTKDDYSSLGFVVKDNIVDHVGQTGFCGLYYHPDDRNVMADPYKQLLKFPWAKQRYINAKDSTLKSLLRVKGFAYAYQFNGCPILGKLGRYAIRVTQGYSMSKIMESTYFTSYEKEELSQMFNLREEIQPGWSTRIMFEEMYGISITTQLRIEEYLDTKDDISPLNLQMDFPKLFSDVFNDYVATTSSADTSFILNNGHETNFSDVMDIITKTIIKH